MNNIKLERIKHEKTQIEIAKLIGTSDTTYRAKEKKGGFFDKELLILAKLYKCSIDHLLEGLYDDELSEAEDKGPIAINK